MAAPRTWRVQMRVDQENRTGNGAAAHGMRLNIASGTAVRFEPGQERTVTLVAYAGRREVWGFRGLVNGAL